MLFHRSSARRVRGVLLPATVGLLTAATPTFANAPFSGEQVIQTGLAGVNSIAAGDLDGTEGADVFHGAEGSQTLIAVFQQPLDTWTPQTLTPNSRMRDVAIADLDGDGDNDLVYGDFNGGRVYWRENDLDGSGAFLARVEVASGIGGAQGIDVADIDGDDDLDVVAAGRSADAYFFIENTAGDASAWTRRTIASSVNAAQVVVAADLDGDGDLDVAGGSSSGSGKLAWYENVAGDGTSWLGRDIVSARFLAVAAGDLDLDGDQDLLAQEIGADEILWFENTMGDGTAWTQRTIASFPAARKGLQAVDLDFDGDLDVVGDPNANWWENIDKATSWTRRSYSGATDINYTDVTDLDGDGDNDIVAARNVTGQVSWWENLTCSPGDADDDSDSVRNDCDVCPGFDDTADADGDLTPDGCDLGPGCDDRVDLDGDNVPDACASAASIAIDNATLAEGDSGSVTFTFTVTLSGTAGGGFTVPWATQDQTATTAGGDYVAGSGTLSFAGTDGEQQTLDVAVTGDARVENNDAFLVVLGSPSSASVAVGDDTGVGTIFNDDTASISIDDPIFPEGDSGTSGLTLTVTSTGAVDGGFSLDFFSGDGSATVADNDYSPDTGTLNFAGADGEQQTIVIQVVGDTKLEADERFAVQLRNPSRPEILIPDGTGRPTIQNDDIATLTVTDVSQVETDSGTTIFEFVVTLDGADVAGGFTVPYTTADGTARVADGDYSAASGTLSFAGTLGETQTISVSVNGDAALEGDETFAVDLAPPSVPGIMITNGTGTIRNDDDASIAIDDVAQAESDAGATFRFTVTLTGEVAGGFTVSYATADDSATVADGDYAASSGTLSFAGTAGETQSIDVTVNGDATVEGDETFTVELGTPSLVDVMVTDGSGSGTLENDDDATIAIDDVTALETDAGSTSFGFTVTLSDAVDGGFTVTYSTADGTAATGDGDYTPSSGTLVFAGNAGETQDIDVSVLGDAVVEDDETFTVELGTPSAANVTAADGTGLGTIQNDDSATIAIDDVAQAEGDAGSSFEFTVTASGEVAGGFTVPYSTLAGTATAADLTLVSGTLSFAGNDGETQSVSVPIIGDAVVESDETFFVRLGAPSKASVTATDPDGLGTIQNDDSATVAIDDVAQSETDGDTIFRFTVTASGEVTGGFTVTYATAAGTATSGSDFAAAASILTFSGTDGETQTLDVTVRGDAIVEADETFTVELGTPSNPDVGAADASGLGTILDDDSAGVAIDDVSLAESDAGAVFTFTVTLDGEVDAGFTLPWNTADDSATVAGGDYAATSGTLSFAGADGETQNLDVAVNGDSVVEADETFTIELGTPSNPNVGASDASGRGTILNDDSAGVGIDDVSQTETNAGTLFTFTVTLSGEVDAGFTLPWNTADDSATAADGDFTAAAGTLAFSGADGETQTLDVAVGGDLIVEADETFTVELGAASNPDVSATDASGVGTILNDDSTGIAIGDVSQAESDAGTVFAFTVMLTDEVAGGFTLPYATADGSATVADGDYTAAAGTLVFVGTLGETQTIDVTVNGDSVVEQDETFSVELGTPSNPDVQLADDVGVGTILNDDDGALLIASKWISSYEPPFDTVVYTLEITNFGAGDQADDPGSNELEDLLPAGLTILQATSDSPAFDVTVDPARNVVFGNGALLPGESVIVTLEATIDAAVGTELSNQALVRFDADHDGVNESTSLSDDPSTPGFEDATVLRVGALLIDIPTLDSWGFIAMMLLLTVAATRLIGRRFEA